METTEPRTPTRQAVIVGILIAGVVSVLWTAYQLWPEEQPPAMPPEKFMETFREADKVDRENWDRMWREAGKKPPPAR